MDNKRIVPHSAEAERAVLGAMLMQDSALARVMERVSEEDFYLPTHKVLFRAMLEVYNSGMAVDEVTLSAALEQRGLINEAGGLEYIANLQTSIPTLENLEHYLSIVIEQSTLRKLISAGEGIMDEAYKGEKELANVLSGAEKAVFDISLKRMPGGLTQLKQAVTDSFFHLGDISSSTGVTGLRTGMRDLDDKLAGLHKSDLIIVAARPAMGKTSFAMNIAAHAAVRENAVVAVFELEMSCEQLATRLLCTEAQVDMEKAKKGIMDDKEWDRMYYAVQPLSKARLFVDDNAGATVATIRSRLRRLKLEQGALDLVVIDYLQLLSSDGRTESRQLEVSEMTRMFKILARDLDVPIMLLSQLSRAPDQRADHHPLLSDLRESGSIEQDADIVIMLYRASAYDTGDSETVDNTAEVMIAKHRNGPTGTVKMYWRGEFTRFENLAQTDAPAPPF